MKKLKKTLVLTVAAASLLGVGALTSTNASASFAQPYPKYLDYWYYGTNSNGWAYSEYYLSAPVRLGSSSSVTDIWGNVKSSAKANYGYANSGAYKQVWWVRADAHYGWYNF